MSRTRTARNILYLLLTALMAASLLLGGTRPSVAGSSGVRIGVGVLALGVILSNRKQQRQGSRQRVTGTRKGTRNTSHASSSSRKSSSKTASREKPVSREKPASRKVASRGVSRKSTGKKEAPAATQLPAGETEIAADPCDTAPGAASCQQYAGEPLPAEPAAGEPDGTVATASGGAATSAAVGAPPYSVTRGVTPRVPVR